MSYHVNCNEISQQADRVNTSTDTILKILVFVVTCNAFCALSSISTNSAAAFDKYSISIPENISKKTFH